MNENITDFIDKYAAIESPGYALMLNGGWGCGKTHFVKEWVEKQKEDEKEDDLEIVLKPIYVSLFGKKTIEQVVYDIKKEITPWLYGKGAKICKTLISCFSQAALHVDINKDGNDDGELTFGFDALSLLGEETDTDNIKGKKILFFDDLERCQIDMKEILGFINYLVEHNSCKVIVVCDNSHLSEEQQSEYNQYKEKTFGRTFTVRGDAGAAFDSFVESVKYVNSNWEKIKDFKDFTLRLFSLSKSTNLRALRQAIHDYAIASESIVTKYPKSPKLKDFLLMLYSHLLVLHLEESLGNRKNFEEFANIAMELMTDEDKKQKIYGMVSKYTPFLDDNNMPRLNSMFAADVMSYQRNGVMPMAYANQILSDKIEDLPASENLFKNLQKMDNATLEKQEHLVVESLKAQQYKTPNMLVMDIMSMSLLYEYKLSSLTKDDLIGLCEAAIDAFFDRIADVPENFRLQTTRCIAYYQDCPARKGIWGYVEPHYIKRTDDVCAKIENKMQKFWKNINNENIDELPKLWKEPLPDNSSIYEIVPMFNGVDSDNIIPRILSLNNGALNSLNGWLRYFYGVCGNNIGWQDRLTPDIPFLQQLKDAIDNEITNKIKLDKLAYERMSSALEMIIKALKTFVVK